MTLSIQQLIFIADWKSKNFDKWNESDIREDFIAPLLALLGYRKGSPMGIEREVQLNLKVPFQSLGRQKIKIDYKPTLRLRGFWILEAKPGSPAGMTSGEFLQTYLYATHPEVRAQMFVLCNGHEVRVYDTLQSDNWENAVHVSTQHDAEATFAQLCELLSANTMLATRRNVLKRAIEDILRVEVDIEELAAFSTEMSELFENMRSVVEENAEIARSEVFSEVHHAQLAELRIAPLDTLINVHIDLPHDTAPDVASILAERIREMSPNARTSAVEHLIQSVYGRPHNVKRVHSLSVLLQLIEHQVEIGEDRYSIEGEATSFALHNFAYWQDIELCNALCHLDNISLRLGAQVARRQGHETVNKLAAQLRASKISRERIAASGTADYMRNLSALIAEGLWRRYSHGNINDLWEGVWVLEHMEAILSSIPDTTGTSPLGFEYYGITRDILRVGTWNILRHKRDIIATFAKGIELTALAELEHPQVINDIPCSKRPPAGWTPPENALFPSPRIVINYCLDVAGYDLRDI